MNAFINIYAETTEEGIGLGVYELIDKVFEVKGEQEKYINVFLIGQRVRHWAREIYQYGVDNVYFYEQNGIHKAMEDIYVDVLTEWLVNTRPEAFLCCSTTHSKSLMPRIAVRLKTGLCADCLDVSIDHSGKFVFTRTAHNGNLMADIVVQNGFPQMATMKVTGLRVKKNENISRGVIYDFTDSIPCRCSKYRISKEIKIHQERLQALEGAKLVVVVGMGIGKKENILIINEVISQIKGAQLGATRAVVEKGWVDSSRQVGQTGRTLNAEVCILCGVSGAIQHVVGLAKCKVVIAINTDEKAPIFKIAHIGIIGDWAEVFTEVIEQLKLEQL